MKEIPSARRAAEDYIDNIEDLGPTLDFLKGHPDQAQEFCEAIYSLYGGDVQVMSHLARIIEALVQSTPEQSQGNEDEQIALFRNTPPKIIETCEAIYAQHQGTKTGMAEVAEIIKKIVKPKE